MTPRIFITKSDAAKALAISLPTLDRLIRAGQIRVLRIGRSVRISPSEVERLGRTRAARIDTRPLKRDR